MPACNLCGRESNLFKTNIEGTSLLVCKNCSTFGEVIEKYEQEEVKELKRVNKFIEEETVYIIEDYATKIKTAREKLGLKQDEIARRIAEKESVIQKVESGHLEPSLDLAKKFERLFKIKLIQQTKENEEVKIDFKDKALTIGDVLKLKDDK
ncbi:MAG: TIGR00270 family protein [Candidatus Woesearchaeota archaeon]|nr:MAG: TIGR00270 family protein [Candidatus Woesearchaeota archaeon]